MEGGKHEKTLWSTSSLEASVRGSRYSSRMQGCCWSVNDRSHTADWALGLQDAIRCPIIGSPSSHKSPGRQFTGKNPPRSEGGGDPIIERLFIGWRYFIKGKHIKFVIISFRAYFFMGRHFNVTPAASGTVSRTSHQHQQPVTFTRVDPPIEPTKLSRLIRIRLLPYFILRLFPAAVHPRLRVLFYTVPYRGGKTGRRTPWRIFWQIGLSLQFNFNLCQNMRFGEHCCPVCSVHLKHTAEHT